MSLLVFECEVMGVLSHIVGQVGVFFMFFVKKKDTCGDFLAICSLASAVLHRCGVTFSQVR